VYRRDLHGMARRSGGNLVAVAEIESRRNEGTVATLRKLADVLGVTVDDLNG
jgi:transcriptional regulator with XRE-family HTH domain